MSDLQFFDLLDGGRIPAFGLGTSPHKGRQAAQLFAAALESGHRLIDTAAQYGNEAAVGAALQQAGVARKDVFVTTKIAGGDQGSGATGRGLEESLRRLGLDYVDLTLIHWPNPSRDLYRQTWEELVSLQQAGKTRHIGVSNFLPHHIDQIHADTGVWPVLNQIQLNPIIARADLRHYHDQHGIITQAWRPLGPRESLLDQVLVRNIAQQVGRTPAQVALRWAFQHGIASIAVSSREDRNAQNLQIFDFELSTSQMEALDMLDTGDRYVWDPLEHEEW